MNARLAVVFAAFVVLTGCAVEVPTFDPPPITYLTPTGDAADALAELTVKGRAPRTGYDRDQFPHWSDLDGDGCDTRAEILERDARPGTVTADRQGCAIGAVIGDPYTGTDLVELPGPGSVVDVEHVVALGDAWQKGAQQLTREQREQFANDPVGLLAVDDTLNRQHGDGDAATWLPPRREFRCAYIARQIAVKARYGLWVTPPERDAMARVLDGCPGQPLPVS
ncbi:MAG: HNH endonuclease [Pseudonocardia sp.]|nr:HNH endonuclease [Pseudonocardia sp.]